MALPVALAGLFSGVQATGKFFDNPIIAYFTVITILFLDSGQATVLGNQGLVGGFISFIINSLTGLQLWLPSWFLLFIFIVFPFLGWFLAHTKQ